MNTKFTALLCAAMVTITMFSCEKSDIDESKGTARIEITDAPIDDANVKSTFVTIADVKLDGKSVEGFSKVTIDLLAYQKGNTKVLGIANLDAKTYSNVTLVLDYEKDQNGAAPGCYVQETNGTRHALVSTVNEITLNYNYLVQAGQQTDLVVDFDLRKAIKRQDNTTDKYDFVTAAELNTALRVAAKSKAGVIKGKVQDVISQSDKVVVYAYKKGQYNRNTEVDGQGASDIEFKNAVTSATVDASGNYELHFLETGEYELVIAGYTKNNSTGQMSLKGTLTANSTNSLNLGLLNLNAGAALTVDVLVTALLPL